MIVSGVHCTSAEQVFISAPVLDSRFSSSSRSSSRPIKPKIMDSLVFCQDLIKFLGKFVNMRSPTKQANLEDTHCKPRGWHPQLQALRRARPNSQSQREQSAPAAGSLGGQVGHFPPPSESLLPVGGTFT